MIPRDLCDLLRGGLSRMDTHRAVNETPNTPRAVDELKRSVLDVARALLASERKDDVIAVVAKLVERNKELELLLAKMPQGKNRSDRTSSAQLELALELLHKVGSRLVAESVADKYWDGLLLNRQGEQLARLGLQTSVDSADGASARDRDRTRGRHVAARRALAVPGRHGQGAVSVHVDGKEARTHGRRNRPRGIPVAPTGVHRG